MTKIKLKRLTKLALKKWKDIINGQDPVICVYCAALWCTDCPIHIDTQLSGCSGTSYWDWVNKNTQENAWLEYMYLENVAYSQGIHPEQESIE